MNLVLPLSISPDHHHSPAISYIIIGHTHSTSHLISETHSAGGDKLSHFLLLLHQMPIRSSPQCCAVPLNDAADLVDRVDTTIMCTNDQS